MVTKQIINKVPTWTKKIRLIRIILQNSNYSCPFRTISRVGFEIFMFIYRVGSITLPDQGIEKKIISSNWACTPIETCILGILWQTGRTANQETNRWTCQVWGLSKTSNKIWKHPLIQRFTNILNYCIRCKSKLYRLPCQPVLPSAIIVNFLEHLFF